MKIQHKELAAIIAKADVSKAEHQRHCDMLTAAETKREKLVATGRHDDPKIRALIADCDLDCRMLPHRIRQFDEQSAALEQQVKAAARALEAAVIDESIRLKERLDSSGASRVAAALKPLGIYDAEELRAVAQGLMNNHPFPTRAFYITQTCSVVGGCDGRAMLGNAEAMFELTNAVEKFCGQ